MKISNENIIFIYLNTKHEVIELDHKLKQLEVFIEERNKQLDEQIKNGKLDGEFAFIQLLAKLSGQDMDIHQIKKINDEKMEAFRQKESENIKFAIKTRLSILDELQVAFDVLKEEMPEVVEKYSKPLERGSLGS